MKKVKITFTCIEKDRKRYKKQMASIGYDNMSELITRALECYLEDNKCIYEIVSKDTCTMLLSSKDRPKQQVR